MKNRIFSFLMISIAVVSLGLSFTSCGDDNDEPTLPDTWTTAYTIQVTFAPDFLDVADITAHFANPDGTFSDEMVTKPNNTWILKGNDIPDQAGVLFTFVPKSNISVDAIYDLGMKCSMTGDSYRNGESFSHSGYSIGSSSFTIKGDKVADYLVKKGAAVALGINDDGKVYNVDTQNFDFGLNGIWEWLAGVLGGNNNNS